MPDRRLVVLEADSTDPDYGKMFGIAPNTATGIPIPTFQVGPTLPAVGTNNGDAYFETTTNQGYVWNGAAWLDISANPIRKFPSDAALLADTTLPTGSYAISSATGNLYIRKTTGWQRLGITEYATVADLLATAPARGTLGEALDEGSLWERTSTGWRVTQVRELADTAAVLAWAGTAAQGANPGDQALALDVDVMYVRTSSGWRPVTLWEDTEANIRAATWPLNGQEAIATDTGRTFARIGGAWIEEPVAHFATEALLLAATPPDGTLAWADDTQVVYTRAGGTWNRLGGPQISVGTTIPATPGAGDMFMNSTTNVLQVSDGTTWRVPQSAGGVVGDVRQSVLTAAQFATALGADAANWVLADGRSAAGTVYATITGNANVPDLRGAYLRMAGANATQTGWDGGALNAFSGDLTKRPTNDFTGGTSTNGSHTHVYRSGWGSKSGIRSSDWGPGQIGWTVVASNTDADGNHSHSVGIHAGGDAETKPKSYALNYFIKVN